MKREIAVIGIVVNDRRENASEVNEILTEFGHLIVGRLGIPYEEKNASIISIIMDAARDDIDSITNKLDSIDGVTANAVIAS
ncbi:MAG: TM1266 family iron-only hydrogenase system putative regulator [Ignavibacteriales bacterium]